MTLFLNMFLSLSLAAAPLILGEAQDHGRKKRPADLIMALQFSEGDKFLRSLRADGLIQEWNIKTGDVRMLGKTKSEKLRPRLGTIVRHKNAWISLNTKNQVLFRNQNEPLATIITEGEYARGASVKNIVALVNIHIGNKTVEIWDLKPKPVLRETRQASSPVRTALALSPDGRWLAAACGTYDPRRGHKTAIEIWDLSSDAPSRQIEGQEGGLILGVNKIIFSHDGQLLAVDTQQNKKGGVRIWNTESLETVSSWENLDTYWVRSLAFRPDGKAIAMGDEKGRLQVWNLEKELLSDVGGLGIVQSLAFSHDGTRLAAGLWDSTIQIWQE